MAKIEAIEDYKEDIHHIIEHARGKKDGGRRLSCMEAVAWLMVALMSGIHGRFGSGGTVENTNKTKKKKKKQA